MPGPARDTTAGRIYNDLRNHARRTGTPTGQVMLEYLLEQASYTAWRQRQGPAAENHPANFADIVTTVTTFADPLVTGAARSRTWDPATRAWQAK
jgi:hypothetical protein